MTTMERDSLDRMIYRFISMFIIVLFMIILAESCKEVPVMKPTDNYKMDMEITNMKHHGIGMVVLPEKELYSIVLESKGKFNYFTFTSCSRELSYENPRKGLNRYKVQVNYRPNSIEARSGCHVTVRGFEVKGRHSRGFIDFKDSYTTLPGHVVCGANTELWEGVSVCQEKVGLRQSITFGSKVMYKKSPGCDIGPEKGQSFEFDIPSGMCQFNFMETAEPHRIHRFTTYGHIGPSIRE